MILVGTHIITPLGESVETNLDRILAGYSSDEPIRRINTTESFAERCVRSVRAALSVTELQADQPEVGIVLSSTKGEKLDLITPALLLCQQIKNPNPPIVVSNACTSGVCAQIAAKRLIDSGVFKVIIIVGCDLITEFIRSGFEILKALSPYPCRPFDANRQGINLGEAVATMIVADENRWQIQHPKDLGPHWHYEAGSIHNDANHITGPSRVGEGSFRCLTDVLAGLQPTDITAISLHGTGTMYNDEMESIALYRAGLSAVPANSLKGYFGHTLGSAGLLETILCMKALEEGIILPTKGFEQQGTSCPVSVSSIHRHVESEQTKQFIKLLSGFGGINAAVRYSWR